LRFAIDFESESAAAARCSLGLRFQQAQQFLPDIFCLNDGIARFSLNQL
jgi:hypothetical protein